MPPPAYIGEGLKHHHGIAEEGNIQSCGPVVMSMVLSVSDSVCGSVISPVTAP